MDVPKSSNFLQQSYQSLQTGMLYPFVLDSSKAVYFSLKTDPQQHQSLLWARPNAYDVYKYSTEIDTMLSYKPKQASQTTVKQDVYSKSVSPTPQQRQPQSNPAPSHKATTSAGYSIETTHSTLPPSTLPDPTSTPAKKSTQVLWQPADSILLNPSQHQMNYFSTIVETSASNEFSPSFTPSRQRSFICQETEEFLRESRLKAEKRIEELQRKRSKDSKSNAGSSFVLSNTYNYSSNPVSTPSGTSKHISVFKLAVDEETQPTKTLAIPKSELLQPASKQSFSTSTNPPIQIIHNHSSRYLKETSPAEGSELSVRFVLPER